MIADRATGEQRMTTFSAQWWAIGQIAMDREIDRLQKEQIAALKEHAAELKVVIEGHEAEAKRQRDYFERQSKRIDECTAQFDELTKSHDAAQLLNARYITTLERLLDESVPGWRTRFRRDIPTA